MNVSEVIVQLYTEAPTQPVLLEAPDGTLFDIEEIRFDRNDNRVILVTGNKIEDED